MFKVDKVSCDWRSRIDSCDVSTDVLISRLETPPYLHTTFTSSPVFGKGAVQECRHNSAS